MRASVDLWYARTASLFDEAAVQALLTDEERARHRAYVFEKNRREYLATRGLERAALATVTGRPARSLRFHRTELGRPVLDDAVDVCFSLTNTVAFVGCATSRCEVGLDAEAFERGPEIFRLASAVFTPVERETLAGLVDVAERERRALELWTAKEAYMKARGLGLTLPPEDIEFDVHRQPANLRIAPHHDTRPERWTLATLAIAGHVVTVCVESKEPADIAVHEVSLNELDRAGESR